MGKKRSYQKYEITCLGCEKVFLVNEYQKNAAKYCSLDCRYNLSRVSLKCCVCKKEYKKANWEQKNSLKKYCSKNCYWKRNPKIKVKCSGCKKRFKIFPSRKKYYSKYYCSDSCRIKFGPTGKLTEKTCVNSNYHRFVRSLRHCKEYYEWRKNILSRDGNKCYDCHKTKNLTVHHRYVFIYDFIRKYGFDKELIYKDKMFFDTNNGQTLCRSCHAKKHRKDNKN